MQAFQNITYHITIYALGLSIYKYIIYIINQTIHNELKIKTSNEFTKLRYKIFHIQLTLNTNPLIQTMS